MPAPFPKRSRNVLAAGRPRRPHAQPKGARWEELRQQIIEAYGAICHLCGHDILGVPDIDHVMPTPPGDA